MEHIIIQGLSMNFNHFSIRTKLILLLSSSAIFALSLSFIASAYYVVRTQRERSFHKLIQLAKITGQNISASLVFDDQKSANNMLQPFSLDPSIQAAMVYTQENVLFASYQNTHSINEFTNDTFRALDDKVIEEVDWDTIRVSVPIIFNTQKIGYIKIISDTQEMKQEMKNELTRLFIVGFIIILIIVVASFKFHKIFTSPIYKLLEIMKNISTNNDYTIQIDTNCKDEFKDLYLGFSSMLTTMYEQKKKIEFIHKQTRDSIEYAASIQQSLLPVEKNMIDFFDEIFTIWQPKDTVGGDIYLFESLRHEDEALLMLIDCTGHGVPGAFVAMIVNAIEKEIVAKLIKSDFDINPAIIMAYFNKHMRLLLHQNDKKNPSNAGFDGAIIYINKKKNILRYTGANTPLFVVQDNILEVFKGDKQSIGYKKSNPEYLFTMNEIDLNKDIQVYLTTDGYLDQTGGEKGFLFGKRRFKKLIQSVYKEAYVEQKKIFEDTLTEYKKEQDTKDDTTVVAFKFKNNKEKSYDT
ncbi:MAG: hypothetical protein COB42_00140 [Sulfurimonas sp.]|nr:MAG: hypothetical protein COB42_00140 [Sulfurimonas sp.]